MLSDTLKAIKMKKMQMDKGISSINQESTIGKAQEEIRAQVKINGDSSIEHSRKESSSDDIVVKHHIHTLPKYVNIDASGTVLSNISQPFKRVDPPTYSLPGEKSVLELPSEELKNALAARNADVRANSSPAHREIAINMDKVPLLCKNCAYSDKCPKYEEESICAFEESVFDFKNRNVQQVMGNIVGLIEAQGKRTMRAQFFEKLDGGVPTKETTALIDGLIQHQERLLELKSELEMASDVAKGGITLKATGDGMEMLARIFAPKQNGSQPRTVQAMPQFAPIENPDDDIKRIEALENENLLAREIRNQDAKQDDDEMPIIDVT